MFTAPSRPARRRGTSRARGRLATAAIAAALVSLPAVAGTQTASATAPKGGGTTTKCTAGALKKDKAGNVTHVCNTSGEWVKVLYLASVGTDTGGVQTGDPTQTATAAQSAIGATALAARADAKQGGAGSAGCALADGTVARPGETFLLVWNVRDQKGNVVSRSSQGYICGSDGTWHPISHLLTSQTTVHTVTVSQAAATISPAQVAAAQVLR